jgi:hypothetical protein
LRAVSPNPRRTPFTFWYLVVLLGTTILLSTVQKSLGEQLLLWTSTDAKNLAHRPVAVLLGSALVLASRHWSIYLLLFTVLVAPLERRVGAWRTFLVFASGHVIATLATEGPVLVAVALKLVPWRDAKWLDVGVSYGLFACAGLLVVLLARPWRWVALALLYVMVVLASLGDGAPVATLTTAAGHVIAVHIGALGWLPWARARGLVGGLVPPAWRWQRHAGENVLP